MATSGATFFRSIGGSFGTAIFGAIFANVLVGNLASHLHGLSLPPGFHTSDITPEVLHHLPAAVHHGLVLAYAQTIQTVFVVSVPICFLAFLASFLIPQLDLKRWPEAATAVNSDGEPALAGAAAGARGGPGCRSPRPPRRASRWTPGRPAPEAAFGSATHSRAQAAEPPDRRPPTWD